MYTYFEIDFNNFFILPSIRLKISWKELYIDWLGFHFKLELGCF